VQIEFDPNITAAVQASEERTRATVLPVVQQYSSNAHAPTARVRPQAAGVLGSGGRTGARRPACAFGSSAAPSPARSAATHPTSSCAPGQG
jgi:hypothetical protein